MCAIMGFSTKKLDKSEIPAYFDRTVSRGPDTVSYTHLRAHET